MRENRNCWALGLGLAVIAATACSSPPAEVAPAITAPARSAPATPRPTPTPTPAPRDPLAELGREDQMRLLHLVEGVVWYGSEPVAFNLRDCWLVLRKLGPLTPEQMGQLKDRLTGPFVKFGRLFWEDAMASVMSRAPVLSDQRRQLEASLLQLGFVTADDIAVRTEQMASIAAHQPVSVPGMTIVLDDRVIARAIEVFDARVRRLEALFLPEPGGDSPEEARVREFSLADPECVRLVAEYRATEEKFKLLSRRLDRAKTDADRTLVEAEIEKNAKLQQGRLTRWQTRVDDHRTKLYASPRS